LDLEPPSRFVELGPDLQQGAEDAVEIQALVLSVHELGGVHGPVDTGEVSRVMS
jgi:hypothetical protein